MSSLYTGEHTGVRGVLAAIKMAPDNMEKSELVLTALQTDNTRKYHFLFRD
jgi:hypothetical protein